MEIKITPLQEKRIVKMIGRVVRHFKGKDYLVLDLVKHTETGELMVLYKTLYGSNKSYVRPFDMFMSEVEKEKYPNATQKYRFELKDTTEGD